jgi:hypothetical protein
MQSSSAGSKKAMSSSPKVARHFPFVKTPKNAGTFSPSPKARVTAWLDPDIPVVVHQYPHHTITIIYFCLGGKIFLLPLEK